MQEHTLVKLASLDLKTSRYDKRKELKTSYDDFERVKSKVETFQLREPPRGSKGRIKITGQQCENIESDDENSESLRVTGRRSEQASQETPDIGKPILHSFRLVSSITGSLQETISDIGIDADGNVFLCIEFRCFCVHVYDPYFKLIKSVEMKDKNPCRITILPNSSKKALIAFGSIRIQFLSTKSLLVGDVITFDFQVTGIASTANNIYLGSKGKIYVLDMNCQVCYVIPTLDRPLEFVRFIHLGVGDRIFYTDYNRYYCITHKGQQILHLSIPDERSHRNMISDAQGYLYVVGMQSIKIGRFHPECILDSIVLDNKDGIRYPLAMSFNQRKDMLFVSKKEECVMVFMCT